MLDEFTAKSWIHSKSCSFYIYSFISFLFLSFVASLSLYFIEFSSEQKILREALSKIEAVRVPSMIDNLWITNYDAIKRELRAICLFEYVDRAEIETKDGQMLFAGAEASGDEEIISRDLFYTYKDKQVSIGIFRLFVDRADIAHTSLRNAMKFLSILVGMSFILAGIIASLFHFMVGRHITTLAIFMKKDDPTREMLPFTLCRSANNHDELQIMVNYFNKLRGRFNIQMQQMTKINDQAHAANEDYQRLFENMNDGFCLYEIIYDDAGHAADYRFLNMNSQYENILDKSRKDVISRTGSEVYGVSTPPFLEKFAGVVDSGDPSLFVTEFLPLRKIIQISAYAAGNNKFATVFQDITEQERSKKALIESEQRFRTAVENLPFPLMIHSEDGMVQIISKAWSDITGYSLNDIPTTKEWARKAYRDDEFKIYSYIENLYNITDSRAEGEYTVTCANGSQRVWDFYSTPLKGYSKELRTVLSMASDITERKSMESELKANQELLQKILLGIRAGIIVVDPKTFTIVEVNTIAGEIFGIPPNDIVGKPCNGITWCTDSNNSPLEKCPLLHKNIVNEEFIIERADGHTVPILKTVISAKRSGKLVFFEVIFDMTERKNLERQLMLAQRLESIGGLAAGIAHEINTPIQFVGDNLSFLEGAFTDLISSVQNTDGHRDRIDSDQNLDFILEEVPKAIAQSREGVARIAGIVSSMKRFSHIGRDEKILLDIPNAIQNTLEISRNEWKYHAEIQLDLDSSAKFLFCVPGEINQVLLNLIVNASHAIVEKYRDLAEEKGTITIKTQREGNWLLLSVNDTGSGIAEKNIHRVFDPFFTTKEVGKGTGQGLALCHDIVVKKHGGSIEVESKLGAGTTFFLRLPLTDGEKEQR